MTTQAIDESIALQWCQQQRPLMLRVLATFYQQYVAYLQPMSLTPAQTQQLAHDLKSTAPSCGATTLALIANQLAPPAPTPGKAERDQLLNALIEVLHSIQAHYPAAVAPVTNAQKNGLEELRQALEQHNLKSLIMFKQWANEHALHWPDGVVDRIQQALNSFDFKRARELLDTAQAETKADEHKHLDDPR